MKQKFFVREVFLGERDVPRVEICWKQWGYPLSRAFLCPKCGALWAQATAGKQWAAVVADCDLCGKGTLQVPGFPELAGDFPIEVMKYEFEQALSYYERNEV